MFDKIDGQLNDWLKTRNLHLQKLYKEEEVRSISVVTVKGNKYQIWLDEVKKNMIKINVWDYGKLKVEYTTTLPLFIETMDKAYDMIYSVWEQHR